MIRIDKYLYSHMAFSAIQDAYDKAVKDRCEFVTPEHVLLMIMGQETFQKATFKYIGQLMFVISGIGTYLKSLDKAPDSSDYEPELSENLRTMLEQQEKALNIDEGEYICVSDLLGCMAKMEDSEAAYQLSKWLEKDMGDILDVVDKEYGAEIPEDEFQESEGSETSDESDEDEALAELSAESGLSMDICNKLMEQADKIIKDFDESLRGIAKLPGGVAESKDRKNKSSDKEPRIQFSIHRLKGPLPFGPFDSQNPEPGSESDNSANRQEPWEQMVTELTDCHGYKPKKLIGREKEMDRAIQILCRKDKNNPIFVGEPGVGKTAIISGIVDRIMEFNVPADLAFAHVYSIDIASLIAGASFHGEFENRLKSILEGMKRKKSPCIAYIDEIHNIMGAGSSGNGSMDASNILKPYLEDGSIRFIGCTTYQEYNRKMSSNKAITRRFQQVDVLEPSIDETVEIIEGIIGTYEAHHKVRYEKEAIRYAVEKSAALIADRFLPDKAIDIIDEAGAYRHIHPCLNKKGERMSEGRQKIDTKLISDILAKVCKINAKALSGEDNASLKDLAPRISADIYGQDAAIQQVVRAVQMAKAGLTDTDKPLASLLFVGPTGVGKTEVCKVLARELGIELVRFDMSEYAEKHTVAKLIGSPAGYIGYDDGGLLTDAIRKSPNCVLLLDEIEKAHTDIYNILLQVMDYAKLTDNKGNKADFKNVILIMTSNAGAQYAGQAGVGFGHTTTRGEAMLQTVKKQFKPEFLNRLSGTVVFNDMDEHMASLILDKKLRMLSQRLVAKSVTLSLTEAARQFLLEKGFTPQYGAREMDRTVQNYLTPLLMEEILFGKLTKGGEAKIDNVNGQLRLS